jgi:DNA-binding beta-propeller fold protein YncE
MGLQKGQPVVLIQWTTCAPQGHENQGQHRMTTMTARLSRKLPAFMALVFSILLPVVPAVHAESTVPVMPRFEVAPGWPHIPNGWTLGQVSSAASDPQTGHIWILHRPATTRPWQKAAPPVLEFDQAGNYLQGWGGAATASGYTWPQSEHGIFIDHKGNVWIGGNGNDDQILKFTKSGQFLMQIGHPSKKKSNQDTLQFWRPADVFVYPKTNELFVADGYGNRRVIVFDADTGAYKRMWGAFGNTPQDDAPPMAGAKPAPALEDSRVPARDLPESDKGPSQFSIVHGIKVSTDGLVYVADRGGKRVQVFTIEGKYLNQAWVDRFCEAPGGSNLMCGNGQTAASVAFSSDPGQRFLYVASRSPSRIVIFDRKTLEHLGEFGSMGINPGQFYGLHHMTTDDSGNLYTSEVEDGRRVQKFLYKGLAPAAKK